MKANRLRFGHAAFATLTMALALAACSNEEPANDPLADGPVAAQVTAGISQTLTRVSSGTPASFTDGDVIHVVADDRTYDYTFNGISWSAGNNPYYFQDRNNVSFRAWFASPDVQVGTDNTIHVNTTSQGVDDDGWNINDILVSGTVASSVDNGATVSFTGNNAFSHIMSQLVFTFKKGDGISSLSTLTGYTVKDVITDATFNTLTCTLNAEAATGNIQITGITGETSTEYPAAPIILVPQTFTSTSNKFNLEVAYNNQTYKAELYAPTGGLQPGYSYTYTVTISNTELKISTAQIKNWQTDGSYDGTGDAVL